MITKLLYFVIVGIVLADDVGTENNNTSLDTNSEIISTKNALVHPEKLTDDEENVENTLGIDPEMYDILMEEFTKTDEAESNKEKKQENLIRPEENKNETAGNIEKATDCRAAIKDLLAKLDTILNQGFERLSNVHANNSVPSVASLPELGANAVTENATGKPELETEDVNKANLMKEIEKLSGVNGTSVPETPGDKSESSPEGLLGDIFESIDSFINHTKNTMQMAEGNEQTTTESTSRNAPRIKPQSSLQELNLSKNEDNAINATPVNALINELNSIDISDLLTKINETTQSQKPVTESPEMEELLTALEKILSKNNDSSSNAQVNNPSGSSAVPPNLTSDGTDRKTGSAGNAKRKNRINELLKEIETLRLQVRDPTRNSLNNIPNLENRFADVNTEGENNSNSGGALQIPLSNYAGDIFERLSRALNALSNATHRTLDMAAEHSHKSTEAVLKVHKALIDAGKLGVEGKIQLVKSIPDIVHETVMAFENDD